MVSLHWYLGRFSACSGGALVGGARLQRRYGGHAVVVGAAGQIAVATSAAELSVVGGVAALLGVAASRHIGVGRQHRGQRLHLGQPALQRRLSQTQSDAVTQPTGNNDTRSERTEDMATPNATTHGKYKNCP